MNFRVAVIGLQGEPVAVSRQTFDYVSACLAVGFNHFAGFAVSIVPETDAGQEWAVLLEKSFDCHAPKEIPELLIGKIQIQQLVAAAMAPPFSPETPKSKSPERKPEVPAIAPPKPLSFGAFLAGLVLGLARDLFFPPSKRVLDARCVGK